MSHQAEQHVQQTRPGTIPCDVEVHHYDQLDDHEQEWLHAVVHEQERTTAEPTGLDAGDVIVFTDYYRIE